MWSLTKRQPCEQPEPKDPVDVCSLLDALISLKNTPLKDDFKVETNLGMYGRTRILFAGVVVAEISHLWTEGDRPRITEDGYVLGEPLFQAMQAIINEYEQLKTQKKAEEQARAKAALEAASARLAARKI
jgi:hypothetical protein